MQKIVPHLWFDTQAKEAAEFYVSAFPDSKILSSKVLHDTPSGDCDMLTFNLSGHDFMAISAGPYFKLNPAISFILNFDPAQDDKAERHLDELWAKLSDGAKILMPLQEYSFSKKYAWIEDKFGVSWQLMLTDPDGDVRPFITPSLMFSGDVEGKAEEAMNFYLDVFKKSKAGVVGKYPQDMGPAKKDTIMYADFKLEDEWFSCMDSSLDHKFGFTEALSLLINCDDQAEIDYYWEKLSAVPEAEQCGWLKDKYGVSWQVSPKAMSKMMDEGSPEQVARVTKAFLQMKKFDIAKLEEAYKG